MKKNIIKSILVFSIICLISSNLFGKELNLIKEKSFSVKWNQNLNVKTDVGDVIVKSWEKNEVNVKIYGDKNAESKMDFIFDQDENKVEIIGEKNGSGFFGWFNRIDLKFEIMIPAKFNVNLKTSGGDLVTKSIEGKLSLKTSGGDIFVDNSTGDLGASTSGGDIVLVGFIGNSDVSTSGGDIEIKSSNGETTAATSGGDIVIKSSEGKVDAKTSGGDISIDYLGVNFGINLGTSGGDISVNLPSNFNADAEIKTSGGRIYNNFENTKSSKATKSTIIGKFNGGGSSFICKTSGGDIKITQK